MCDLLKSVTVSAPSDASASSRESSAVARCERANRTPHHIAPENTTRLRRKALSGLELEHVMPHTWQEDFQRIGEPVSHRCNSLISTFAPWQHPTGA